MNGNGSHDVDEEKWHAYLSQIDAIIEAHGWMAQGVFPRADTPEAERGAPWMYTVGHMPDVELCVVGLGQSTSYGLLGAAHERAIQVPGDYDSVLTGYMVRVVAVNPRTDDYPLTMAAQWRARHGASDPWAFTALQVLWPDVAHRLPGDEFYDDSAFAQPVIQPTEE